MPGIDKETWFTANFCGVVIEVPGTDETTEEVTDEGVPYIKPAIEVASETLRSFAENGGGKILGRLGIADIVGSADPDQLREMSPEQVEYIRRIRGTLGENPVTIREIRQ